ncbi:glycoside hydrolase [Kribbella turkmenica]|uniref:Glycoside hydrolase n=1 Tax=Kribbella turkmenica TaxID=2530375 RepID=A0A4R4WYH9_9ACTN|nr:glycosyl hydrolase [Kribbella turkmenica]TDD22933.1 glycoside hydrolase [Kribbella turkmenica]
MATVDDVRRGFRAPPGDGRVMMRWWWFGPSVDQRELERQLRAMAAAGLGGVEAAFVYPMSSVDAPFGSDKFLRDVGFAARTAHELGLRFDLTLGSGWSFGGGHVPPELAARRLTWDRREIGAEAYDVPVAEPWPGDQVVAAFVGEGSAGVPSAYDEVAVSNGMIRVPAGNGPREVLVATSRLTGQNVKRAAAGAEGPVLDHYSAAAAEQHLRAVAEPLLAAATPGLVGSVFCDSLEVYQADWTPDLPAEFERRRGYDLLPRLWELLTGRDRVRIDFYRTLSELYEENFVAVCRRWAAEHGVPFRIQSYGEPPATMSSYRHADLFEGEGWGWTRLPETRWASSAANTYGRPVVSAEAWTWVHSPSFRATPLDLKGEAHEHFLSGVNQLIGHGWPYSPSGQPGVGWIFYAAGALDDRNPWWPVAPDLFGYLHRVSWLLQQGTPVRPVKVYVPASDAYAAGTLNLYRAARRLIGDDIPRIIRESGLDFDLIDDDATTVVDPAAVGLVVVPGGATVPGETRRWLEAVIAAGGVVTEDLAGLADQLPAPLPDDVGIVHRRLDDGDVYFVANTGNRTRTFTLAESTAERWDPVTGSTTPISPAEVTLSPYEAAVLVPASVTAADDPVVDVPFATLDGSWRVFGESVTLPHRWEDDPAHAAYSGWASYEIEFELPEADGRVLLDFGAGAPTDRSGRLPVHSYQALLEAPIGVAAEVWVNESRCGTLWAPPYRVDITDAAKQGTNALRVVVHNTNANALSVDQHLAPLVESVTARYGRRFDLQDIEHAADSVSSGLFGPPAVILRRSGSAAG